MHEIQEGVFYNGIMRGKRPDGFGVIFTLTGNFTVRGRFANARISGIGRVVNEKCEVFDGIQIIFNP